MTFRTIPALLASAAERFGDAPALVTPDRRESFNGLTVATHFAAATLRHRGLKPGDRVLMAAPNSMETIHVWLGTVCAGGIPVAVNPESKPPELDYLKRDLEPRLTLMQDDVEEVATSGDPASHAFSGADPMDVAAIVYTSGTTSRPKGVMVRHAAYTETGQSFAGWLGLGKRERLWACLPFFHINAQAYTLMGALAHGFSLALSPKFHASTFWTDARDLEVTSVNVVGAMLEFVAAQPAERWVESRLQTIYAAPAPAPDLRKELEARFRVRIITGYGLSENPFGCIESESSREKRGSIGRPRQPSSGLFTNELRIVRPDGSDAGEGEVGELCFRNPVMTAGYWNAPEITATALRDGWLHTGDAGYRDADGDVFLSGRYKEMIRRRGENIAPAEVEDALGAHPAVAAVAVFGIANGLQEEEVVAVVVRKDGSTVDEEELKRFAATRLASFKVPAQIVFRESLPMTPTHRVAKDVLRREHQRAVRRD